MRPLVRTDLLTAATLFMILGFSLPSWIGLAALLTGQWDGNEALGKFFLAMIVGQSPIWAMLQTGLIALVAAPAALNVGRRLNLRSGLIVWALAACFVPLMILAVYLISPLNGDALWSEAPRDFVTSILGHPDIKQSDFMIRWNAFLTSQIQVLAAQIALFLGLQSNSAAPSTRKVTP